jgi:hypothetical protein
MPSRRLPQTDDQRSTALQVCNVKYQNTAAPLRLISATQFTTLGGVLSPWRGAREALGPLLATQTAATATAQSALTTCVRVISHFIQVLNFAIERGTLTPSARAFYELPISHAEVPDMNTAEETLLWAARLATGETARIGAGGPALAWPAIAEVNTAANALQSALTAQSTAKDAYDLAQEIVSDQRPTVDPFIKDLWDTIEFNLRTEDASSLRRKAREWGVVYDGEEEEDAPPAPPAPPTP